MLFLKEFLIFFIISFSIIFLQSCPGAFSSNLIEVEIVRRPIAGEVLGNTFEFEIKIFNDSDDTIINMELDFDFNFPDEGTISFPHTISQISLDPGSVYNTGNIIVTANQLSTAGTSIGDFSELQSVFLRTLSAFDGSFEPVANERFNDELRIY